MRNKASRFSARIGANIRRFWGSSLMIIVALALPASAALGGPPPGYRSAQRVVRSCRDYVVTAKLGPAKSLRGKGVYWGEETPARTVLAELKIEYRKKNVFFRRGIFSDLCDVQSIGISRQGGAAVVQIAGGDAASAYTCCITLKGNRVVERVIRSGEEPADDYERTTYVIR